MAANKCAASRSLNSHRKTFVILNVVAPGCRDKFIKALNKATNHSVINLKPNINREARVRL